MNNLKRIFGPWQKRNSCYRVYTDRVLQNDSNLCKKMPLLHSRRQFCHLRILNHRNDSHVSLVVLYTLRNCHKSLTNKDDDVFEDNEYNELIRPVWHIPGTGHKVIVIQPIIKRGPQKRDKTNINLLLEETITLVHTLENWTVQKTVSLAAESLEKSLIFGSGNFQAIKKHIQSAHLNHGVTAAVVSIARLSGLQHATLEKEFKLPVYDRHTLVLQIFKEHASTKEAKLQIALAEIPLLKSRIKGTYGHHIDRSGGRALFRKGSGETFLESRERLLTKREIKLKLAIKDLESRRDLLRSARKTKEFPIISVVGYTNAGKTSLIKALTEDTDLEPKNQLFATLDVTAHAGILPNKMQVLYMDTIGFIIDLPTNLIESFKATLQDIRMSDLIIHIRDLSHPHYITQKETVIETLKSMNVASRLLDTMIEVDNKVDLVPSAVNSTIHRFPVSCISGEGIPPLRNHIQEITMQILKRRTVILRVPTGGQESRWLYKKAAVTHVSSDEDSQFSLFHVVITEGTLNQYNHLFCNNKK